MRARSSTLICAAFFLFFVLVPPVHALQLDLLFGGNVESYDDVKTNWGVGFRSRLVWPDSGGLSGHLIVDSPSILMASDIIAAVGYRIGKNIQWDIGAGPRYSTITSLQFAVLIAMNIPITNRYLVAIHMSYRHGGLGGIYALPYMGIKF